MSREIHTHFRPCNLCEATCGLEIKYRGNETISIRGDKNDLLSRGHICPKAVALKDTYNDPDRLRKPVIKKDKEWKEVSYEEAFNIAVSRIKGIQERYGNDSVAVYLGNPVAHNIGLLLNVPNFIKALKTKQRYSATSVDQLPHNFAAYFMFGHYMLLPIPDIDRTNFFLIIGANPAVSNGSIMTAPDVINRITGIKKRGGKIVVVDPRRTETAKLATKHFFIKPNTDALLLLSMLNVIFKKNLDKPGRLEKFIKNYEQVKGIASNFSPERVSKITGISANDIERLAGDFATSDRAVCYGRFGASTQEFGGLTQWLINVLNIVTGNFDREGGAMFTTPAVDLVGMSKFGGSRGSYGRWRSRVKELPEFAGELPVTTLADEILTPGEGQVKGLITIAGNPVLTTPSGRKLEKALSQLEFMLSVDIYINETTSFADLIIPTATGLEAPVFEMLFYQLSVRNFVKYAPPLMDKGELKYDWEVIGELTTRINSKYPIMEPEQAISFMLQMGPYGDKVTLEKLKDSPYGIDLGELKPQLPERLFTEDGKIDLIPAVFVKDLTRLEEKLKEKEDPEFPFILIGRRDIRSSNSWLHNSQRLIKGRNRSTMLINSIDAENLGIKNGEEVRVTSTEGSIIIKAEISDKMMQGVVSIPNGWGHNREGVKLTVAGTNPGVSVNDITQPKIDKLTGNAAFSGTRVRVERGEELSCVNIS